MSNYYKYNFISPEPIYSTVKEELKSYFDTGAVDDLLFPTYLDKALKKLGRATYVIAEETLYIEDFQARLPDNFYAAREAWMCAEVPQYPYQSANSFYSQASSATTIQISPIVRGGDPCDNPCPNPECIQCDCNGVCMPILSQAVYKTNTQTARSYRLEYLLKPGTISAKQNCGVEYTNNWEMYKEAAPIHEFTPGSASYDSFDIRDNKFVTNFRNGTVHLIFYATEYDHVGNQMVPDNYRIREYVEAFLKFKVFETLTNQTNDETFNQLQQKLMYHKQAYEEAYIMADIEIKKQTAWDKQRRIKNDLNRFNMYELPNRTNRHGRRRNN
jgi:hypothetical protein